MAKQQAPLAAISDSGKPIDWWFLYKIAGDSTVSNGTKAKGTEYVYFDNTMGQGQKLKLSPDLVGDPAKGLVSNTLNQIYNNLSNPDMGWFFYNDEDPITEKTNGNRGHTKGVLCFDLSTNSGFWLIDSAPKFPPKGTFSYPESATQNAQTFLCITLQNADTAKSIAAQMYQAQQPNVYLASKVPAALTDPDDPRALLIQNKVTTLNKSYANFITFLSKGGQSFRCIAKNKFWDQASDDDFYNDLVGPVLAESIEVETWEHDPEPGQLQKDKVHTVVAMKSVNLAPLGINPSYEWSETNDHAKLVVSDDSEKVKYVCVGDINFTVAQEKRSGGTVAFIHPILWSSIIEILSLVNIKTRRPAAAKKAVHMAPGEKSTNGVVHAKKPNLKTPPPKT